ncbi:MAG: circularly permuted type 2 ATP-grasp protein, partial [Hyphomonas sp.]|nr:circularly permuted type 2 ATP-grasp protein [Hyphomonas sp.]
MGEAPEFFDEMQGFGGSVRAPYAGYEAWLREVSQKELLKKSKDAYDFFRRTGITFNVYGEAEADERLIPFDLVPRIISAQEWANLVRGIEQRVKAINAFLHDIYHRQEIIRAGRVPERLIRENDAFQPKMIGFDPPGGIYTHIVGVDLVRTGP